MSLRRPSPALLASFAVHIIVVAFFVQALVLERPIFDVFGRRHVQPEVPVERIGFLALPRTSANTPPTPGKRGGNGKPLHIPPPVVAPTRVPTTLPPVPTHVAARPEPEPGTGPAVGGGGDMRGVQPRYTGPELWTPPGRVATAPKSASERLDSVIASQIDAHNDSVRVATGGQRAPGDWTVEHNGKKYGIDSKFIHLGSLSIPTAVLAMLPLNITNNPTVSQRERSLSERHDEIFSQAQRGMNEADFQKAVRSIRERKERERERASQTKGGRLLGRTGINGSGALA